MPGVGENNQTKPLSVPESPAQIERSRIYTMTGDSEAQKAFKDPLIGQILEDKYLVEEVIGWGGMSVVYRARHVLVDRIVAIKTIKFRADERPDIWQRFQREIVTLSRLSHPNVVTVYDCLLGESAQPYVVMDFLQGASLDDLLVEDGRLPLERVRLIACQVAAGVEHAHRHDVIHRDIKPANIMIIGDQVKVVDFGLAKLGADDQKLTQTGQLWGSPPYISPEQIKGGAIDHRSDIYSLGAVVYEMVTGRDPFFSEVVYEMLHQHLHNDPPPFAEVCPDVIPAPELEAVLHKAMAKNPNQRYQTMNEFKEALEQACLVAEKRGVFESAVASRSMTARIDTSKGRERAALPAGKAITKTEVSAAKIEPVRRPGQAPQTEQHAKWFGKTNSATNIILGAVLLLICLGALAAYFIAERPKIAPAVVDSPSQSSTKPPQPTAVQKSMPAKTPLTTEPAESNVNSPERSHHKRLPDAGPIHAASSGGRHSVFASRGGEHSSTVPVKKSLPNASHLRVDQSKFELLRDLKSPSLRQDCGDIPQH